jgi:hypothetical protein
MARVEILPSLEKQIEKKFKARSVEVLEFLKTLETHPKKGKPLATVGGILIKELKFESFRFYFLVDAHAIKIFSDTELIDLLLKFVRMSDKNMQQQTIEEIKYVLKSVSLNEFR